MKICGIQKTSLVDYPGHMATVIFTGGCNFSCPYCHNSQLIDPEVEAEYTVGYVLQMLEQRKHLIDAVVISGGEPTLQPDLHAFISKLKSMGFKVKLDTNGSNPDVLKKLIADGLLDYVAMDVKDSSGWYNLYTGQDGLSTSDHFKTIEKLERSINILIFGDVPYEFRTTVAKQLHNLHTIMSIGRWIKGAENYYIQNYKESEGVLHKDFEPFDRDELEKFADAVRPYVKNVYIRGI